MLRGDCPSRQYFLMKPSQCCSHSPRRKAGFLVATQLGGGLQLAEPVPRLGEVVSGWNTIRFYVEIRTLPTTQND